MFPIAVERKPTEKGKKSWYLIIGNPAYIIIIKDRCPAQTAFNLRGLFFFLVQTSGEKPRKLNSQPAVISLSLLITVTLSWLIARLCVDTQREMINTWGWMLNEKRCENKKKKDSMEQESSNQTMVDNTACSFTPKVPRNLLHQELKGLSTAGASF